VHVGRTAVDPRQAHALDLTFLVMLTLLVAAGLALLSARSSYASDIASALESDRRIGRRRRRAVTPS
jgi:hypothetical protein